MPDRSLSLVVCLFVLACLGQPVFADITFADFTSVSGITLNGNAAQSVDNLRLVDGNTPGEIGTAWFSTAQSLTGGFSTEFQFSIGGEGGGAGTVGDGLAFVIQTGADGTAAIGTDGAQVGFGGIVNSLAVEFATNSIQNNVAFVSCGLGVANDAANSLCNLGTSVDLSSLGSPISLTDGSTHTADVSYVPGTLKISVDGQQVLIAGITLGSEIGDPALVGFTAATGDANSPAQYALTETARIFSWDLSTPGGTNGSVPEPSSLTLLGLGVASTVWFTRRKRA